jgi:bifunctional DNA-binding transcriptional regulator/antitoxin component of YhaV-PrlF toxin-antitoxin module
MNAPTRLSWLLLLHVPAVTGADHSFQPVILDRTFIAYERDVGDVDGDGGNDVVAVQEGDTDLQVLRAPDWTRSTLVASSGTHRYPRADDLKLVDFDGDGDLDVVTRLSAEFRRHYGLEEGDDVIQEPRPDGVLIRPAATVAVRLCSDSEKARLLLEGATTVAEYARARKRVRDLYGLYGLVRSGVARAIH